MSLRILALDTATEGCSVALWAGADGSQILERSEEMTRGHADRILSMVREVLAEGGVALSGLDGIAVGVGPGAFTGVRISVAVGQALAFGAGLPVVPITSLEALAWRLHNGAPSQVGASNCLLLAALDARMGEVYWGGYRALPQGDLEALLPARVGPPSSLVPSDVGRVDSVRGIGRGFSTYPHLAEGFGVVIAPGDERALPRAREAALLGALRLRRGCGVDPAKLAPEYLRDKVASTTAERAAGGASS